MEWLSLFDFRQSFLPQILLGAAVLLLLVFACSRRLKLRNYHFSVPKLQCPVTLLVYSDLHSCRFGKGQRQLVQMAEDVRPDYILFPGDTVDDRCDDAPAWELLTALAEKYPCIAVSGNHEYRTGELRSIARRAEKLGVRMPDNARLDLPGGLSVTGLQDSEGLGEDFTRVLSRLGKQLDPERFNLLLVHRPEHFDEYRAYGFDMVICGHTHGGQWRLPGVIEGVFASGQGLFPAYAGGVYEKDGCRMVVSRGLSRRPYLIPRIFNRPEAVAVYLQPRRPENGGTT